MNAPQAHSVSPAAEAEWLMNVWRPWAERHMAFLESQIVSLEQGLKNMSDILDTLKADFEAYQTKVTSTLSDLQAKVAALTAGQLDPAKAQAIDDEIKAAAAALTPPAS